MKASPMISMMMKWKLISIKMMTGSLDPDVLHETLCRCHLEFFDAFLAHRKPAPQLQSSAAAAVTVFPPDTAV